MHKPRPVLKPLLAALLVGAAPAHGLAQVAAQVLAQQAPPNAGAILQQMQPPAPPVAPQKSPTLEVRPKSDAGLPTSQPIAVKTLRITGNTAFATETLHALVADQEGKSLTLQQLEAVAARITAYYQANGHPVSRAVIPVQSITDGTIIIQVVEARYGNVRLNNRSGVGDAVLNATLAPLVAGALIADAALDRTLLLLSDVPGVGVNAVLKPGATVGTSDIEIEARETGTSFANLALDNYGNRYIGRARLSGNVSVLNPLHAGDVLSAGITTTGDGMNYGRLAYDALLNGQGTRVGSAFSALRYRLGSTASALDANGTATVGSAWIRHPFIRSKQTNLYAQVQYDAKKLRDHIDVSDLRTDRHLRNWIVSVNADQRDTVLGGGMSTATLSWTSGRSVFDNADAAAADAATARARGGYAKWNLNLARLQGLTPRDTLYLAFGGQWADRNLDSAEKMSAGGPYTVRAYDIGAVSGDTGYTASAELRHELGTLLSGSWQAQAFIDNARVRINRQPWTSAENGVTLSGAGVGLNWTGPDQWRATAAVAARLGAAPALLSRQSSVRAWLVVNKNF
ncbi:ShlB/FhaC/HecB family hemolysin secretion/activation protein [Duganella sp. Leaf126]|uniref:ShlB/FhaC/HecB family hemolysin secretion/activation protein n=1 Tax=Duganella sp. Leaf126 TaxID=1736266 RepID=UPI001E65BD25|nr:ShlB/FhaC/HecB family hemolysin secretion/activation protein [Duganella sp. Leaf126]